VGVGEDTDSGLDAYSLVGLVPLIEELRAAFWRCCWLFSVIRILASNKLFDEDTVETGEEYGGA
jgi:hypothetical protein